MSFKKTVFPNYLNRPKIFILWEVDEVAFVLLIGGVLFAFLFVISAPTWIVMFLFVLTIPFSYQAYIKLKKQKAPNWLEHFLYDQGISTGVSKHFLRRNGFSIDDDTIPSSSIHIFED